MGKTTCAAARAVAEARRGRRVLVVSTDPAHSLGDALDVRLTSRPSVVKLKGLTGELTAFELNGPRAFEKWLHANRQPLGDAIEHGTWLDRSDIDALLDLSIPGVDELMALVEIARLAGDTSRPGDLVIVDTAPTGHTLRLLGAPETVAAVAALLDELQEEHRLIRTRFGRAGRPEAADRLIETLARQARDAAELLQDPSRSAFHLVTLAEELSIAETDDARAALDRAGIPVAIVIVNRVIPQGPRCALCDPRRAAESKAIARLRRLVARTRVTIVDARVEEPRGVRALAAIGDELMASTPRSRRNPPRAGAARDAGGARGRGAARLEPRSPSETMARFQGARLLLFGGKGGAGKTTCSAAVAIRLADAAPTQRVLLLSTDPAHSLGDVLDVGLDDEARTVAGAPTNLSARELDARRALASHRESLEAAVAEIASTAGADAGVRGVRDLMDLAPPGIDELFGILSVVDSLGLDDAGRAKGSAERNAKAPAERSAYDLVVCDTAPTGHALRLLELPDAAREWVQALMRVLLKYRELVRPGQLARELVELSQSIRRLQAFLRDPDECRFIAVTRAADVPALETGRLLARLRALGIAVPAAIVNAATLQPDDCPWCRRVGAAERAVVARLRRTLGRRSRACAIIQTPLVAPPPRGVRRLRAWGERWITP